MGSEDEIVLGIDLGTTFSAMAHVNRWGKPEIITNAEGFATTPSVIHFYDRDACVVGDEAVKMVVIDPDNVVRFIKRNMGEESFSLEFYGKTYTPQEISALILRKMRDDAEELTGETIRDAVVTVPAYFNSAQRGATAEAGQIAGLNVLSIINEPTAAAIAYGLDRIGGRRKLLVFDLGGGTFDVTVMEIRGTKLTTISSDGNAELGGKDWDDRLLNHVAEKFYEKYQLDPRDDPAPYQELYERCLHAKISLSTKKRAVIPVNYRGNRMVVPVERQLFESLTADLLQQCEDTSNIVLEKARLLWSELDDVLLVGGSTRMPAVRSLLTRLSSREPAANVNPDECVALGAGLAGVFRHRPDHPALQMKRKAMADRARELEKEEQARQQEGGPLYVENEESPLEPDSGPTEPPSAREEGPRAAAIGLAYGGHVAQEAMEQAADKGAWDSGEFGAAKPVDKDEIKAVGQAFDRRIDGKMWDLPPVEIRDCTTHPLGIIVLDKQRQERVVELVPEGTPLPHDYKGRFAYAYENMTAVRVEVTEGVGDQRDEVAVIGKVELTGLPPRPRGTPIEVIYAYGVDQILSVRVIDVETGKSREGIIRLQGSMSADQVRDARSRNQQMAVD
jgi:molecular chaperone DnaK